MKKLDYLELLSQFNQKEYEIFNTLSSNEDYVAQRLYLAIRHNVAGASSMFLNTGDKFRQWITFYTPKHQELSYLDTIIIGHIHRNPDWSTIYNGSTTDIDTVVAFLIASWKNYTKSLKVNMNILNMIYQRYVRFLNTDAGQAFAYGLSIDLLPEFDAYEEGAYYEDKPFYEAYAYREEQLMKFKKACMLKLSKSAVQNVELRALWDLHFNSTQKFSYIKARELVRKEITKDAVSDTALYYHLKKLRVALLKEVLANVDEYFDADQIFEVDGKVVNIVSAIKAWLVTAEIDSARDDVDKVEARNIIVANAAESWAVSNGLKYSKPNDASNILIQVKGDIYGNTHDHYSLYFYKGGGYKDFRVKQSGFYTDVISPVFINTGIV